MPTYQYKCTGCGSTFEEMQKISDPPLASCPTCGEKPERIITGGAGLIFRGSGFYLTDYKGSGKAPSGEGSEKQSGKSSSGGGAPETASGEGTASTSPASTPPSTQAKNSSSAGSASKKD